jgi:PhzF family phenazine biosynthesis protein
MKIDVPIVNAFVDGSVGGNPAGIVLNAQRFTKEQKQRIAAAIGLSETAFVSPSLLADFKLEFFTPVCQIAHCGHATIATYCYLKQIGMLAADYTSKETIDGRREIIMDDLSAFMEQSAPLFTELSDRDQLRALDSIGVQRSDLLPGVEPIIVNTGNAFLVFPLRDIMTLQSVRVRKEPIEEVSTLHDLVGYYLFSQQTAVAGRDAGSRMFAPRYGIIEEAATGMAAGPLACFLHTRMGIPKSTFLIEQGRLMPEPSPSIIQVRLKIEQNIISRLLVGGNATIREVRTIEI